MRNRGPPYALRWSRESAVVRVELGAVSHLAALTRHGTNVIVRRCPPKDRASPWKHLMFAELPG